MNSEYSKPPIEKPKTKKQARIDLELRATLCAADLEASLQAFVLLYGNALVVPRFIRRIDEAVALLRELAK